MRSMVGQKNVNETFYSNKYDTGFNTEDIKDVLSDKSMYIKALD